MIINMIGSFVRNDPFGTEIAFAKGLKQAGVEVFTWDPSRQPTCTFATKADATIVFKDHGDRSYDVLRQCKAYGHVMIEYQPDDIRAPGIYGMMKHMRQFCDYAFTFDMSGANLAVESIGYKKAKKILVTADPDLYKRIDGIKKEYDMCFIGSLSNSTMHKSRNFMIDIARSTGKTVVVAGSLFDPVEINMLYNKSRIVLNHATDVGQAFGTGYGYQCRHFEAGFAGACLLSNELLDNEGDGPIHFASFNSENILKFWINELLYQDAYVELANKLYNEVNTFHAPINRAHDIITFIQEARDET